jgi:RNA polymerase sigma-70 factor (ECF subfamily)
MQNAPEPPAADADNELDSLARSYGPALRSFFRRRAALAEEVDDLAQDVLIRLIRRGSLADVSHLGAYVFQTAANILRDRKRRDGARAADAHDVIDEMHVDDAAFTPERVLLGQEALDRLRTGLLDLPERTREVFFLGRIERMPYADVAERLGISLSAVNKHMAKALIFLVNRCQDDGD